MHCLLNLLFSGFSIKLGRKFCVSLYVNIYLYICIHFFQSLPRERHLHKTSNLQICKLQQIQNENICFFRGNSSQIILESCIYFDIYVIKLLAILQCAKNYCLSDQIFWIYLNSEVSKFDQQLFLIQKIKSWSIFENCWKLTFYESKVILVLFRCFKDI